MRKKEWKRLYAAGVDVGTREGAWIDLKLGIERLGVEGVIRSLKSDGFLEHEMHRSRDRSAQKIHKLAIKVWRLEDAEVPRHVYARDKAVINAFSEGYYDGFRAVCVERLRRMLE